MRPLQRQLPLDTYDPRIRIGHTSIQEPGTPLPGGSELDRSQNAVLVQLNVLQTYERIIFELQQQVIRYKVLLDQFMARSARWEEGPAELSTPISTASSRILDSIARTRIPDESILRAYDEE